MAEIRVFDGRVISEVSLLIQGETVEQVMELAARVINVVQEKYGFARFACFPDKVGEQYERRTAVRARIRILFPNHREKTRFIDDLKNSMDIG